MFLRFIAALTLPGLLSVAGLAQRPPLPRAALDTDIRVFCVAAALNVATSQDGGKFGTNLDPDLVRRLKQFYTNHKGNRPDESQLAQYVGLALNLTDPPEFKPRFREEQLPDDVRALLTFPDLLREFYLTAHLTEQWQAIQPQYETEMGKLQPKVGQTFLQVDAYLRSTLDAGSSGVLRIIPEVLAYPNTTSMRVLDSDYYVIVGPNTGKMDDIRHAYLHFRLDAVVNRGMSKVDYKERYLSLLNGEQGVNPAYTRDFGFMADESLIRAMELRIDRSTIARAQDVLNSAYRSGLLFAPFFYENLAGFQTGTLSFPDYFTRMAQSLDLKTETARFQATFRNIAVSDKEAAGPDAPGTTTTPLDPVRQQLIEAQTAFNSNDNEGARALFEKVLQKEANNGAALYGLALIASRANDVEQSQIFFERTVKSSSAEPSMKVWSYIYLGHIADLQCKRDKALEYYRQAVQIGDNTRDAQASATSGLNKAFGDQCR